ncbi:MAG TPA: c-type cytochrome [Kofleriaceae bacterium]|jgi:mono/diheme cytochrome c family protein|nr:c-type cytochrome [Kofleriaceae bacterium]
MKLGISVGLLALALAGGCSKKKDQAGDKTSGTGSAASVTGGGSATAAGSGSAATPEAPKPDPKLVERGDYLASILGCGFCHMPMGPQGPDTTRQFAGGLEVPEKFGTWRAPNITPHTGSGIGNWTEEQIVTAIREGTRPDGSKLLPIMPYLNYNRLTDDDAKAIAAYLKTVPAIDNVVAPNKDLKLPPIPAPKPANAPDVVDDPLKHGEYLVTLMHCNMCHTPMTKDGMPDMARMYGGGMEFEIPFLGTGTLYGPNISSDPETGIGKWTEQQVADVIKTMKRPDGTIIQGPMQFYLAGWSKLEDRDVKAIAAYVKTIPPIKNKVPKSTFKPHQGPPPGAGGDGAGSAAAGSAAAPTK